MRQTDLNKKHLLFVFWYLPETQQAISQTWLALKVHLVQIVGIQAAYQRNTCTPPSKGDCRLRPVDSNHRLYLRLNETCDRRRYCEVNLWALIGLTSNSPPSYEDESAGASRYRNIIEIDYICFIRAGMFVYDCAEPAKVLVWISLSKFSQSWWMGATRLCKQYICLILIIFRGWPLYCLPSLCEN